MQETKSRDFKKINRYIQDNYFGLWVSYKDATDGSGMIDNWMRVDRHTNGEKFFKSALENAKAAYEIKKEAEKKTIQEKKTKLPNP